MAKRAKPRSQKKTTTPRVLRQPNFPPHQKLWAPWRLQYILDPNAGPLQEKPTRACVFCDHQTPKPDAATDRRNLILDRGEHCFTVLNKFPYTNGHLMVIPYQHFADFSAVPGAVLNEWMLHIQRACAILKTTLGAQGLNVGMNLGRLAGAGIPNHVHMHVVPRWEGDVNFMAIMADTRVLPEYIDQTYARLLKGFQP